KLKETIDYADEDIVKNVLAEIVPTYKPYKGTGKKDGNTVVDIHSLSETAMAADTTEIN
ncbi:MAG TPA: hypothetical protein GXX70_08480, partial [Tepidimicrobium sp.]|nr:hypothetical protein [Tepidimicrobium sp.]